jgi:hypothetical protein
MRVKRLGKPQRPAADANSRHKSSAENDSSTKGCGAMDRTEGGMPFGADAAFPGILLESVRNYCANQVENIIQAGRCQTI